MNKKQKVIYYYVRYSLKVYLILFPFNIIFGYFTLIDYEVYEPLLIIYAIIFLPCLFAFSILPGIIYDNYRGPFHGITWDQIKYRFFLTVTLGLGPIYIFFKEYDPILKKYYKEEK